MDAVGTILSQVPLIARERLAFLHIEKTAGTAVIKCLSSFFSEAECCPVRDASLRYHLPADLAAYRFFSAHSNMEDFEAVPKPRQFVTVLRDPVDRALSYYEYLRYQSDETPHADPRVRVAKALDVNAFFFQAPDFTLHAFSNHMTGCLTSPHRPFSTDTLARAKENLHRFACVGVVEHIGLFIDAVIGHFDLQAGANVERVNVTRQMRASNDPLHIGTVDPAVIERIRELNQLDIALYEFALAEFVKPGLAAYPVKLICAAPFDAMKSTPSCVVTPGDFGGVVLFGPYRRLFPGQWAVAFELAVQGDAAAPGEVAAVLDIYSGTLGRVLATLSVLTSELAAMAFTVFTLRVDLAVMVPDIEFRVWKQPGAALICRDEVVLSQVAAR